MMTRAVPILGRFGNDYEAFLSAKRAIASPVGREPSTIHRTLFPFQRDITAWAVRHGRAAIFADTGLGKTFMQVEWARQIGERTLFVAPLGVTQQTIREAAKIGVVLEYARTATNARMVITNYEMIDAFAPADFGAVVLDESSILKAFDGKTRTKLIERFAAVPYRLCCTATPAPNDIVEIGNHAEFLGVLRRGEMLATFFIHDSESSADAGWRLKGHAREPFFRWLSSWGMTVRMPSDLGYSDEGFVLPALDVEPLWLSPPNGSGVGLFHGIESGIKGRLKARRTGMPERLTVAADLATQSGQWILWCGLNDEGRVLAKMIRGSVLVEGQDAPEDKAVAFARFQNGETRVLITKPKIGGFGLNFQNAHQMVFVGLSDSWEAYYQCVRRCWRYGQTDPVTVRVVLTETEQPVWENVQRKDQEAEELRSGLMAAVKGYEQEELHSEQHGDQYERREASGDGWDLWLGDSAERLREVPKDCVGLSIFSPPFLSLYTYTGTERDLGNSRTTEEFFTHFKFIIDELLRVTMPGRLACVHVSQVPARAAYDGYIGIKDFRGDVIRAFSGNGWIYHGEVCIDKDPQVQAVRSHAKQLLFVQLYKDSAWSAPAYADYILIFRKPGENLEPVSTDLSREQWIEWARPVWYGIRQSDTLNTREAKEEDDERHVAALQLGVIERCIRLWSNRGDLVLSPFAGIGSEGYVALKQKRQFLGIELKPSYWRTAAKNLKIAASGTQTELSLGAVETVR